MKGAGLLSVESVYASHGSVKALWDVTLQVDRGEVVAVVGANGAGKSTLLRSIMGLVKISGGSIRLGGEDITRCKPHQLVARGAAFVPEGRRLFGAMSAEENLRAAMPRTCPDAEERIAEVMSIFPQLAEKRRSVAWTLSGGEQQMVAFGRALMSRPKLLVVDEPSVGLSPAAVERVLRALRAMTSEGASVLLAEQDADLALGASDRAYAFANGRVVLSGASSELASDPRVREAYLGEGVTAG